MHKRELLQIKNDDYFDTSGLQNATRKPIKIAKNFAFQTEIQILKGKRSFTNSNKILNLNVFLKADEAFKVGGRL